MLSSLVPSRRASSGRQRAGAQRGLSLVELLVGVAIGLFIVAAAALMVGNQLTDNRRLLLETQLQQDMRATVDLISRQLRRAGTLASGGSEDLLASDSGDFGAVNTLMTKIELLPLPSPPHDGVAFRYFLNLDDQAFKYEIAGAVVKAQIGGRSAQDLTDANTMKVTALRIRPPMGDADSERRSERIPCPKLCPPGTPGGPRGCWPTVTVRNFRIELEAESARDARVKRRIVGEVRVRNDRVDINTGTAAFCPA